jgi:hypothetical protein
MGSSNENLECVLDVTSLYTAAPPKDEPANLLNHLEFQRSTNQVNYMSHSQQTNRILGSRCNRPLFSGPKLRQATRDASRAGRQGNEKSR